MAKPRTLGLFSRGASWSDDGMTLEPEIIEPTKPETSSYKLYLQKFADFFWCKKTPVNQAPNDNNADQTNERQEILQCKVTK